MLTIAIVEDKKEYAAMLQKRIMETDLKDKTVVDIYLNPIVFLDKVKAGKRYQLCFSDVMMPEMDGMKLAEEVREVDGRMLLVFLSSYVEYAPDGYRVQAFDYLLKGREDEKWDDLIKRIRRRLEDDRVKVYRIIAQNKIEMVPLNSIIYIYKEGKYCNFVLEYERERITVRKTMKEVGEELDAHQNFIQIKRGYIINIEKIRKYTAEEIIMENGDSLVIGRMHVVRVRELVMKYAGGL